MKADRPAAVRGVVFDLDGTLIDTMPLVLRAVAHALAPFVAPLPPEEIYRRVAGPADRCLGALLGGDRHVPEAVARLFAYVREHGRETVVYPGAVATIDALRAAGRPVALWTGRDRASATAILEGTGLGARFDAVVCGDDLTTHKPDPEGLRHIAAVLGVPPAALVLVGDAEVDVLGAHRAGAVAVLIHEGRTVAPEVRALRPYRVATPGAAFRLVGRLTGTAGHRPDGVRKPDARVSRKGDRVEK